VSRSSLDPSARTVHRSALPSDQRVKAIGPRGRHPVGEIAFFEAGGLDDMGGPALACATAGIRSITTIAQKARFIAKSSDASTGN
jgi:hypothetical protein